MRKRKPLTEIFLNTFKIKKQAKNSDEARDPEVIDVTNNKVLDAIEGFKRDIDADQNGLNAVPQGHGPGLRVLLKDGKGTVIRQWTGEEFLKLREAAGQSQEKEPGSGKILDQKL